MIEEEEKRYHKLEFHKALFISALTIFSMFALATFLYQYSREKAFRQQQLNDVLQTDNYTILNAMECYAVIIYSFIRPL